MRPLITYDLDDPPTAPSPSTANPRPPPAKKRKRNHRNPPKHAHAVQHWDDPGSATVGMVYDDHEAASLSLTASVEGEADAEQEEQEEEEEEESRPLTHEEIWDDSALIDAWNAAEAEFEAYHGASKSWKAEPAKKSPLWYNKPYTPKPSQDAEPDTAPLDFDSFVPTHDPSLALPPSNGAGQSAAPLFVPPPSTTMVSRDEAFNNALSAMYWSGYWTAVYHCQTKSNEKTVDVPAEAVGENGIESDEDEDEDEEDLVPAQR